MLGNKVHGTEAGVTFGSNVSRMVVELKRVYIPRKLDMLPQNRCWRRIRDPLSRSKHSTTVSLGSLKGLVNVGRVEIVWILERIETSEELIEVWER